jgi:hypothetical protein
VQSSTICELCQNRSVLLALTSNPHCFGWVSREHCIQISDPCLLLGESHNASVHYVSVQIFGILRDHLIYSTDSAVGKEIGYDSRGECKWISANMTNYGNGITITGNQLCVPLRSTALLTLGGGVIIHCNASVSGEDGFWFGVISLGEVTFIAIA